MVTESLIQKGSIEFCEALDFDVKNPSLGDHGVDRLDRGARVGCRLLDIERPLVMEIFPACQSLPLVFSDVSCHDAVPLL